MSVVHRIRSLITHHGVSSILIKAVGKVIDHRFESRHGIDTIPEIRLSELQIDASNREHATSHYEGSRIMPLRQLMRYLEVQVAAPIGLVDCGCGKGKVLLAAAEQGFRRVVGVEFAPELCKIARDNWSKFQQAAGSPSQVIVIQEDVAKYEISVTDNLFFLFNPFDDTVLAQLLANIAVSLRQHPRRVAIAVAFMSESYRKVFERQPELKLIAEPVFWACRFSIFASQTSSAEFRPDRS